MVVTFHSPHSGKTQELCRVSTSRVALLKLRESTLSRAEEEAIEVFLKPSAQVAGQRSDETTHADATLQETASSKRRRTSSSKYRCTSHASTIASVVERANSHAKLSMTDRCSHMHPETLQLVMAVKLSKNLWPSESVAQEALGLQQEEESSEDEDDSEDEESKADGDEDY